MLGRVEREHHGRVKPTRKTEVRIVSATAAGTLLRLTFDQPVVLRGTPGYTTDLPGVTAESAASPSLNVVEITFSGAIDTATQVNIPVANPAVRSKRGGFVADTTFPM